MINQRYAQILHDKIEPTKLQSNWLFTLLDLLSDHEVGLEGQALDFLIEVQNHYNRMLTQVMERESIPNAPAENFKQ